MLLWGHMTCYMYTLGMGEKHRVFQEYQHPRCQDASRQRSRALRFETIFFPLLEHHCHPSRANTQGRGEAGRESAHDLLQPLSGFPWVGRGRKAPSEWHFTFSPSLGPDSFLISQLFRMIQLLQGFVQAVWGSFVKLSKQ